MGGILILIFFLGCGVVLMDGLFPRKERLARYWLGLCAGLALMMWLPTLYAFFIGFTSAAQLLGAASAAIGATLCAFFTRKQPRERRWTDMPAWLPLALIVPMVLLGGYLQYTHTLREVDGALHVGQSTYGDLNLHLGIATSLRNAAYPPDYSLLPGTLLGYPFLGDSMVTTMLLFGAPLALSFTLTGTLMMALVFTGFVILCWKLTRSRAATALAFVLMFVNGGLGFLYALDGVGRDASAFHEIFTGFYKTPTNQPDLNLRWVNVICDMMIPQRTLLTGWMMLIPALTLLTDAVRERSLRAFIVLGVWAGAMPMVHTHSFLGLGLLSVGAVAYVTARAPSGKRLEVFLPFAAYGAIAVALALPQLMTWSVPQTVNGGSLRFFFNWVNNQGDGRLIDGYCWFWVKNVGLIWLLMIPAALSDGGRTLLGRLIDRLRRRPAVDPDNATVSLIRMLACGALLIYVTAELFQFQPNIYDNNKLFYVAYMVMLPAVGLYLRRLWDRLKGLRGRALIAAVFLLTATLSGALSIGREIVSDYVLFGADEVEAARFIEENLPADATFLTGDQHNNAVAALTGRDIVCGTASFLYFHGVDFGAQHQAEALMLASPGENAELFEEYNVDYVYLSGHERYGFDADVDWFVAHGAPVFANDNVMIRAISDSARALAEAGVGSDFVR